jgi:hypothetical protein
VFQGKAEERTFSSEDKASSPTTAFIDAASLPMAYCEYQILLISLREIETLGSPSHRAGWKRLHDLS